MKYLVILPILIMLATLTATVIIYAIKRIRDSVNDQKKDVVRQYEDFLTKQELEYLYGEIQEQKQKLKRHDLL